MVSGRSPCSLRSGVWSNPAFESLAFANEAESESETGTEVSILRNVRSNLSDGRLRPLGIPTVRDRVVQMAVLLILEPIFEADFRDSSYGFQPCRSDHDALDAIRKYLGQGKREVYDADLKGYFDTIPHDKLLAALYFRISDRSVLHLLRTWLECTIEETDQTGPKTRHKPTQGTPQGGVISPLLANI